MVEHLVCIQGVIGSSPFTSTDRKKLVFPENLRVFKNFGKWPCGRGRNREDFRLSNSEQRKQFETVVENDVGKKSENDVDRQTNDGYTVEPFATKDATGQADL